MSLLFTNCDSVVLEIQAVVAPETEELCGREGSQCSSQM